MTARHYAPVVLGLWLVTVVGQASVGPPTEVKVVGGRVHIQATAASVSEVLDRLSRTTGMKIVYDGAPPTDRLTAAIDAGSETEALSRLLEGLGLTYAFKLDTAGRHVETLFVSNSSRRSGTAVATTSAPRPIQYQPSADDDPVPPEEPDPADDPAAMTQGVVVENGGMATGAPGYAGGGQAVPGPTGFEAQSPEIPGAASFPTPGAPTGPMPPVTPGFPTFPGPVSYP